MDVLATLKSVMNTYFKRLKMLCNGQVGTILRKSGFCPILGCLLG